LSCSIYWLRRKFKFSRRWEYFTYVDVKDLNDVLRTSGHTEVNEDDGSDEINVKDCDGDEDDDNKE